VQDKPKPKPAQDKPKPKPKPEPKPKPDKDKEKKMAGLGGFLKQAGGEAKKAAQQQAAQYATKN
jgi:hypothetical protein